MALLHTSKKKILIYGINQQAQQLYWYLSKEGIEVEAFCVDRDYFKSSRLLDKPVVCFEEITQQFPPDKFAMVLSFGYKNMVENRKEKYMLCKKLGYDLPAFISDDAKCYTDNIGDGTNVYPNTVLAPFVQIGSGCFIEIGCTIAHHSRIGNFNFFAPGVTTGGGIAVGDNCFFGISSIIASGKKILDRTLVGAGVCITEDTLEGSAYRHSEAIALTHRPEYYI